jgi:hypothetical protein
MSVLSGSIGSTVTVDSTHVTGLIQKTGSAMLAASEASVSFPVGFDLEGAIVRVRDITSELSGQLEWKVQTGEMVQEGQIIATVSNQDIPAVCDGWLVRHKEDKADVGERIGIIRTKASTISEHTIREWRAYLQYWNKSDVSDLMPLRERALSRRNSLFGISRGASVWQVLSPMSVIEAESDKWDKMLDFIPKAANAVIAKNVAKAILAGKPSEADEPDKKEEEGKKDESDNEGKEEEAPKSPEDGKSDEKAESPKSEVPPKTDEEVRRDEALNRAKLVKVLSSQVVSLCDDLSKFVGNAKDVPQGDLWAVEELMPILIEMDQSARLLLVRAVSYSIGLDA